MTNLKNLNLNNLFDKNNHIFKVIVLLFLHLVGALILTYFVVMVLVYLGFIGELSSQGIFFLWQKLSAYFLPAAIIFLSILVVTSTNPVYALICLILVFFSSALFLLSLNVNFLAMIYLIIYIGAIAILFLFVIMMFNLRELKQQSTEINDYSFLSISFIFYFFCFMKVLFYTFRLCSYICWIW